MNPKLPKKTVALTLLSTAMMLAGIASAKSTMAAGEENPFREQYVVDETITVPDMEIEVGGEMVKAEKTIVYPDGRQFRKDAFTPSVMGAYKVVYEAKGETREYDFYVAGKKHYVEGEGSAVYKAHPYTPSKESMVVTLSAGAKFHFDEVLDLKELGPKKSLFSFYPVTATPGVMDATTLKIRFTDVYDASRYIQYEIDASREGYSHGTSYMRVGGDHQTPTGIEASHGKVHVGTIWGYPYPVNWYCCTKSMGSYTEAQYLANRAAIFFDYNTMEGSSLANGNGETLICDLDNKRYFEEPWGGLTTGEVKLSAWFEGYQGPEATLCITGIGNADLKTSLLVDETAPTLKTEETFEVLPEAILHQKYRFYDAIARDQYSGNLKPDIRVYRDYYTSSRREVPVEEDGFIPSSLGTYYAVYTAKDYSGNVTERVYEISCVSAKRDYEIVLEEGYAKKGYVGTKIAVAKAKAKGATGETIGSIYVEEPDGTKYEIKDGFSPKKEGTYRVHYRLQDFIGTVEETSYEVDVTFSEAPLLEEEASLLPYYLAGSNYELPVLEGIDYAKGENAKVQADVYLVDNGKETKLEKNTLCAEATSERIRDAKIRYRVSNEKAHFDKEYPIRILTTSDDGFVHMDRYFVNDDMSVEAFEDRLELKASGKGSATFGNPISSEGLRATFRFVKEKAKFQTFTVTLTDSLNQDESIALIYRNEGDTPRVYLNSLDGVSCDAASTLGGGDQFVSYDSTSRRVSVNTKDSLPIKTTLNGEAFEGFSSGSVYLKFAFEEATGDSALSLLDLNGQEMSSSKYDYIRPQILLRGDYGGARDLNERIELCAAKAVDVLDPAPSISLSVYGPGNLPVTGVDGKLINKVSCDAPHAFVAENYGNYRVTYEAKDLDENNAPFTYIISVNDKVVPSIELVGTNPSTAVVGEKVTFAEVKASDNLTAAENLRVERFILAPTGHMTLLKDATYTFRAPGRYVIRTIVFDEAMNMGMRDDVILVKEAE